MRYLLTTALHKLISYTHRGGRTAVLDVQPQPELPSLRVQETLTATGVRAEERLYIGEKPSLNSATVRVGEEGLTVSVTVGADYGDEDPPELNKLVWDGYSLYGNTSSGTSIDLGTAARRYNTLYVRNLDVQNLEGFRAAFAPVLPPGLGIPIPVGSLALLVYRAQRIAWQAAYSIPVGSILPRSQTGPNNHVLKYHSLHGWNDTVTIETETPAVFSKEGDNDTNNSQVPVGSYKLCNPIYIPENTSGDTATYYTLVLVVRVA